MLTGRRTQNSQGLATTVWAAHSYWEQQPRAASNEGEGWTAERQAWPLG